MHSAELRRCLEQIDVVGIRELWQHVSPHLLQPQSDLEALAAIHMARTSSQSLAFKLRAYSHRWLLDHELPSQLPDELKPKAERIYPVVARAVGISVNSKSELFKPIVSMVRGAMEDSVKESYADGRTDPVFIKTRMMEARKTVVKQLLGIKG